MVRVPRFRRHASDGTAHLPPDVVSHQAARTMFSVDHENGTISLEDGGAHATLPAD
jgi:hypothetical protein